VNQPGWAPLLYPEALDEELVLDPELGMFGQL